MARISILLFVAAILLIICIVLLVIYVQNSVDEARLIRTPNIPFENAVLTSMASVRIRAPPGEVFAVISRFKDPSDTSPISGYKWQETDLDGVPEVGSKGTYKASIQHRGWLFFANSRFQINFDDFATRIIPIELSLLDRERMRVAERSTSYPPWILGSERVQEVVPIEGYPNVCEYRTFQTIEGIAAYYLVLTAKQELAETQRLVAEDVKMFVEKQRFAGDMRSPEKQLSLDIPGPKRVTTI